MYKDTKETITKIDGKLRNDLVLGCAADNLITHSPPYMSWIENGHTRGVEVLCNNNNKLNTTSYTRLYAWLKSGQT